MSLFGRHRELREIDNLIASAASGSGGAVVVRGEAGIGKSSILAAAETQARALDWQLLTTTGVASEANLAFAGLRELLRPILGRRDRLLKPQRRALEVAFGEAEEPAADPFLIGLATLNLVGDLNQPVLIAIDDAHWLDQASSDALIFAARRFSSDPIVLLAAVRDGVDNAFDAAHLPEMPLLRLDPGSATDLLSAAAPDLESDARNRVLQAAAGNPLALIELAAALRTGGPEFGDDGTNRIPLTTRLESAFAAQAWELPEVTRTVLLLAAADEGAPLVDVLRAATAIAGTAVDVDSLAPAVAAKLVDLGHAGLRFRHPLVRSAIYQTASVIDRQAAHAALAAVLLDRDRQIWHRSASSLGPDESLAVDLEAMAERARGQGAIPVAIAALERAAQLSEDPGSRGTRLLTVAELAFQRGRHDVLLRALGEAETIDLSVADRPRLAWLREWYAEGAWSGAERVAPFVRLADEMTRAGDRERALQSLLTVALRVYWSNPDAATRELVTSAAERIDLPPQRPELIAILALAAPLEYGSVTLDRLAEIPPDSVDDPEHLRLLGLAATTIGAWDRAGPYLRIAIRGLRAEGRLGPMSYALVSLSVAGVFTGHWPEARSASDEAVRLTRESTRTTWQATALCAAAALDGIRGDTAGAESLAAEAEGLLLSRGANPMLALVQMARGFAYMGAGRPDAAFEHLRRVFDPADIAHHRHVRHWVAADFVDAAMRTGQEGAAREVVAELEPELAQTRSPLLRVNLAFARAVLASEREAESRFQAALAEDLAAWPFIRGRILLGYGEWLRRHRRASDARRPLRMARETFDALGAAWWGAQARTELRASGETSRRRVAGAIEQLTPQELQVALMAADGLTNREIGDQLYLSHRTIAFHLHQIYGKLEITSRAQLHLALQGAPPIT
jgi:DNA-binding CsgD family transcriptional regulator/tetratricopeptide (TPR) repeat protein